MTSRDNVVSREDFLEHVAAPSTGACVLDNFLRASLLKIQDHAFWTSVLAFADNLEQYHYKENACSMDIMEPHFATISELRPPPSSTRTSFSNSSSLKK